MKGTKFTAHAQYHVTCAYRRSRKTTRNNFSTKDCLFTIQLYAATMTIDGSLYWSIPI